ncbi:guanine-N(7)-methyltransferase domain-containing protein [Panaeolus papilionaceus]|nr:guanine-N(7)-methyltransferase domain-containing protein [Panaeolus papilionaceus]
MALPYAPKRIGPPPEYLLKPLSLDEMKMFRNYRGQGALRLLQRKRGRSNEDEVPEERPTKRHTGDVDNSRPDVGVAQRQESPIIGLKNFNNWVKSVLITRFAHPAFEKSMVVGTVGHGRGRMARGKVLDMGCGKGGDITKWAKAQVKELVGADIAAVSIDQARSRWESLKGPRFDATFAAIDCYQEPLSSAFPPERLAVPFDVVSMQFCMHYAFETEEKARCMLNNVSRYLRPGGIFIGTIPNAEFLLDQLDKVPPDAQELKFGNEVYTITFEDREDRPLFGHKYWFFLKDAVDDVPEYVVHWENFVEMAAEYGLVVTYKEVFHQVFADHQEHPEFKPLMLRMKVVDANGESAITEEQWDAANIYIAFAFEKR